MGSWTEQAVPVFQIVGTLATAAAAVAAWLSASAARSTAARADETSHRAREALGRATAPSLEVTLVGGDAWSREPQQMELHVRNDGGHLGVLVDATVERTDGHPAVRMVGSPVRLGSAADNAARLALSGPVVRLRPNVQQCDPHTTDDAIVSCTVDYTDASSLVRWRHRVRVEETAVFPSAAGGTEVQYGYSRLELTEPEVVSDRSASTPRPPGWVRRTWHRVW